MALRVCKVDIVSSEPLVCSQKALMLTPQLTEGSIIATMSQNVLSTTAATYHPLLQKEISSWTLSFFDPLSQSQRRFAPEECPASDPNFVRDASLHLTISSTTIHPAATSGILLSPRSLTTANPPSSSSYPLSSSRSQTISSPRTPMVSGPHVSDSVPEYVHSQVKDGSILSGPLYLYNAKRHFKKYHFVLLQTRLLYFKTKSGQESSLGGFNLQFYKPAVIDSNHRKFSFTLLTLDDKVSPVFAAPSQLELDNWKSALSQSIVDATPTPGSQAVLQAVPASNWSRSELSPELAAALAAASSQPPLSSSSSFSHHLPTPAQSVGQQVTALRRPSVGTRDRKQTAIGTSIRKVKTFSRRINTIDSAMLEQ